MQLSDITNLEKVKTKSIATKKQRLDPMDMSSFKFEWILLDDEDYGILSTKYKGQDFDSYEQALWYQNQRIHFSYPLILDNSNVFSENQLKTGSLQQHNIDELKRHSLLTWLGYVIGSYDTASNETYFLALALLDNFLSRYQSKLTNPELLSVGICCLSLASKQKDVYALTSKSLKLLTNNKLSELDLIKCQFTILQTLNYQIEYPTYFMYFDYMMRELEYRYYKTRGKDIKSDPLNLRKMQIIYKCSLILLKFVTQYYDSTMHKLGLIAYGCIFYTVKRMEMLQLNIPNLSDILVQIQKDQGLGKIEKVLKLICKLCQNGMSQKQVEFLPLTTFNY